MGKLVLKAVPQLLVAPGQNEGGPVVVVLVELDAPPLVLDRIRQILLPVRLPEHGVHDVQNPVLLEDVDGGLVDCLHVCDIGLVQILHSQHVLLLQSQEHGHVLLRRGVIADLARLQDAIRRREGDADPAPSAAEAAPDVGGEAAARAQAKEAPVLELLLPDRGALQEVFVLQVRDGQLVPAVEGDTGTQDKGVVVTVGPAARGVARVRAHGDAVVEDQTVLLVVAEGVVSPGRDKPLHALRFDGFLF
mmetsp:Transcript_79556/g.177929  ORF Transcript_79556/g.177929 Transcript_79556/m.177929 type:complete len:248 (+) Transcript_79556:354-1097(+)